jgi:hypothetical protein
LRAAGGAGRTSRQQSPRATQSRLGGDGNGHGDGLDDDAVAVGLIEIETTEDVRTERIVWSNADLMMPAAEAEPMSMAEQRALLDTELAVALGEKEQTHDVASHYKVCCPECGSALMLQEGCRKCSDPGCGWAAC